MYQRHCHGPISRHNIAAYPSIFPSIRQDFDPLAKNWVLLALLPDARVLKLA